MKEDALKAYYALTPLLWLLDAVWGINIRAAAFEGHPLAKNLYFALCVGCAWIIWKGYRYSNVVALIESSFNTVALIIGYLGPYYRILDIGVESGLSVPPFAIQTVINFGLSGLATVLSFHQAVNSLQPLVSVNRKG